MINFDFEQESEILKQFPPVTIVEEISVKTKSNKSDANPADMIVSTELQEGSVVWAKLHDTTNNYPSAKWPGVICKNPEDRTFFQNDKTGALFTYYVKFLGNPHTTGYSLAKDTELYSLKSGEDARKLKRKNKNSFMISLNEADKFFGLSNCKEVLDQLKVSESLDEMETE